MNEVKNSSIRMPLTWGVVLAAIGGLLTYLGTIYATQAELAAHAADEATVSAQLETRAAVVDGTLLHHDKAIGELRIDVRETLRTIQAVNINVHTLMIEADIPRSRIARPRKEE